MISLLLSTLLIGFFIVFLIEDSQLLLLRFVGTLTSFLSFFFSLFFWVFFNESTSKLQFVQEFGWFSSFNIHLVLGIDGISIFFLLLSTFLIPVCLLFSWSNIITHVKEFFLAFLLIEILLVLVFSVSDLFIFYTFFESLLVPTYLVIGLWGSRERKIRAAFLFFLYTLFGSVLMLLGVIYFYLRAGTTDFETLVLYRLESFEEKLLWLSFFLSFASKIPMIPLHIWLPEAHVEAPTAGSVLLAGILLKLGTYGFLRFSLGLFPTASYFFTPLLYTLSILGVVYASFTAIRQTDLKRIIAYTSIAHMNLVVMGIFCFNPVGITGAIFQSVSHGFVSAALFLLIGVLYDRFHARIILYFSGLVYTMPIFTFLFFIFTMSNIALPLTSSFVGEFLLLIGIFQVSGSSAFLGGLGMIIGGAYSLWLFNRIAYGNVKLQYLELSGGDINKREFFAVLPIFYCVFFLGVFPNFCLGTMEFSVLNLIEISNPVWV
jgi:proton-translocating NADH-quinone oxidoreductase chain M